LAICPASSCVNGASFISNLVFMHPFECWHGITATAALIWSILTWDQVLWCQIDVWPCGISKNLDSIRNSRSSSMSPAWSTVLRNMLISQVSQEISSINIIP
jgi:hypothetical protein